VSEGTLSRLLSGGNSSPAACPNLKVLFGKRYRVWHEESYYAERPQFRAAEEPWLQIIPCAGTPRNCPPQHLSGYTHIYPWDKDMLAVYKAGRNAVVVKRLVAVGCQVHSVGSDGTTLLFPVALFPQVAEVVRPLRRRRLSPEARRAAGDRLRKYQFRHAVEFVSEALESPSSKEVGPKHVFATGARKGGHNPRELRGCDAS
jgi:hypothetical protein